MTFGVSFNPNDIEIVEQDICVATVVPLVTLTDNWTGTSIVGNSVINNGFSGSKDIVTITCNQLVPTMLLATTVRLIAVAPGTPTLYEIDLGDFKTNVTLTFDAFGTTANESLTNVSPTPTSVAGAGTLVGTSVNPNTADGTVTVNFNGPVRYISFYYNMTAGGTSGLSTIAYTTPAHLDIQSWKRLNYQNGVIKYIDESGTILTTLPAGFSIVDCPDKSIVSLSIDTYRIASTATGVSTPSNNVNSNPIVGNTVTINGPYKSIYWCFLRETVQDNGTGTLAKLTVNGFDYYAGSGPQYQTIGQSIQSSTNESFYTPYRFTVSGTAFVEIVVTR